MNRLFKRGLVYVLMLLLVLLTVTPFTGPPPTEIVFFGFVTVNNSVVANGTTVEILANGNTLVMDTDSTVIGGYYPDLKMEWDDPDTGTDEGITYANEAEIITFRIGGAAGVGTNFPDNVTVNISQAGEAIELNLSFIFNFAPQLLPIFNQSVLEDTTINFSINATDNNSLRNDTLFFADNSSLISLGTAALINPATNLWQVNASISPGNSDVGNITVNFSVSDDGRPPKGDSQVISVEIINVNDAPTLNIPDQTAFANRVFTLDVSTFANDIDPTGDTLNFTDNSTLFNISLSTGIINFTPTVNDTGDYSITIQTCDNNGACVNDTFTLSVRQIEAFVLVKNLQFASETSSSVTYTVNLKAFNFLGNLTNVSIVDSDLGLNTVVNITDEDFFENSSSVTITKSSSSSTFTFNTSIGTVNNTNFLSNQPSILVPGTTTTTITVGGGGGGGGSSSSRSGGGGACASIWECTEWEACSADGTQQRNCTDRTGCADLGIPIIIPSPNTTRSCDPIVLNTLGQPCAFNADCVPSLYCDSNVCSQPTTVQPVTAQPSPIVETVVERKTPALVTLLLVALIAGIVAYAAWMSYRIHVLKYLVKVYHKDDKMIWQYRKYFFRFAHTKDQMHMMLELSKERKSIYHRELNLNKVKDRLLFTWQALRKGKNPIRTVMLLNVLRWKLFYEHH